MFILLTQLSQGQEGGELDGEESQREGCNGEKLIDGIWTKNAKQFNFKHTLHVFKLNLLWV